MLHAIGYRSCCTLLASLPQSSVLHTICSYLPSNFCSASYRSFRRRSTYSLPTESTLPEPIAPSTLKYRNSHSSESHACVTSRSDAIYIQKSSGNKIQSCPKNVAGSVAKNVIVAETVAKALPQPLSNPDRPFQNRGCSVPLNRLYDAAPICWNGDSA